MDIHLLGPDDVDDVAGSVARNLAAAATKNALINSSFDHLDFTKALLAARHATWVARRDGVFAGHLFGAVLEDSDGVASVWIGPDGASFDTPDTLWDLYSEAAQTWLERGAYEHFVWTFDDVVFTAPWSELGFARVHQRGARPLRDLPPPALADGLRLRRGDVHDIDALLRLDEALDEAQRMGPSFLLAPSPQSTRSDLLESLEDPLTSHVVVEDERGIIAQCQTYELPPLRGTHSRTLYLSGVSVLSHWRGRGVGRALIEHALRDGWARGLTHAEVTWRVTNHGAARFWRRAGFTPTFVRLHRTVGRY